MKNNQGKGGFRKSASSKQMRPSGLKFSGPPKFSKNKLPPSQKKAQPAVKREQASSGWNNSNMPESKFFDKNQDRDFLKK